jgi:hypothetical protein
VRPWLRAVTVDNFVRAETDNYLATNAKEAGVGKLSHHREPASTDHQTVIRLNRDTLYSFGVFDLAAGPVTVTLPDAGKRFMSLQIINEDHYVPFVAYDHKPHTLTEKDVGTRYVMVAIRTLVDPNNPKDLEEVHKLQDAIKISQKDASKLELPNWDQTGLKEIREALLVLAKHTDGFKHAFGAKNHVDPIKHLIGTAAGWGGNPDEDATYIGAAVPKNDGTTLYKLHVTEVPVDAFWSVSVYNSDGYFQKNLYNAYSLNNITSKCYHHPVRRLRRKNSELPADHARLELHGAALSAARRNPEQQVEISQSRTGRLRPDPFLVLAQGGRGWKNKRDLFQPSETCETNVRNFSSRP